MVDLGDWNTRLAPLFSDERYLKIREFLKEEYKNHVVYPDMYDLYNCFKYTQFDDLKVVLLGQDPYHNVGQAHGLCFSVLTHTADRTLKLWALYSLQVQ